MSTAVRREIPTDRTLPPTIHFIDKTPVAQKVSWCWLLILYPLQKIGIALRDSLYLPLYTQKYLEENRDELTLATEYASKVKDPAIPLHSTKKIDAIRDHFSVRDVHLSIGHGETTRVFKVRLFESKVRILGKKIQLILFSFYNNTEESSGSKRRWEPLTMKMLSQAPVDVLKALKEAGIEVDALVTQSLGNVIYDAFQYLSKEDQKVIPQTLIINRGLVSIRKIAHQLFSFPFNWILYAAAKISGWNADPERELLDFLSKSPQCSNGAIREVVIIEASKDHYYSGPGSFDPHLHTHISNLKIPVFRGRFFPGTVHPRAHHAISLSKLTNNSASEVVADGDLLNLGKEEKISAALARKIFSKEGDQYTCFYVSGNGSTLDVGTYDVSSLLVALIRESQRNTL